MCFFKFNVEPVELDQRHPDQAFGNLRFLEKFLIGYHAQSLLALYQLRHTSNNSQMQGIGVEYSKHIDLGRKK